MLEQRRQRLNATDNSLALDLLARCDCGERVCRQEYLAMSEKLLVTFIDEHGRELKTTFEGRPGLIQNPAISATTR